MGRGEWFIRKKEAGWGALGDIGVHLLDLAWYLMGSPKPVSVSGATYTKVAVPLLKKNKLPIEVDEFAAGFIRFENGQTIALDVCWDSYMEPGMQCQIFGDKGGALAYPTPKVFRGVEIMESIEISTTFGAFEPFDAYTHFIDCVRNPEKKMIASGQEIVQLVKMLDGISRSAKTGKEIRLK